MCQIDKKLVDDYKMVVVMNSLRRPDHPSTSAYQDVSREFCQMTEAHTPVGFQWIKRRRVNSTV